MPALPSASAVELATKLVATLPKGLDSLFNPWTDTCETDTGVNTPQAKLIRLAQHLDCDAKVIICGEAPGYQGCRHSGVAFTSERLLLEGQIPRVTAPAERLTTRKLPWSEPSATIVWGALEKLGIAEHTILWNALQMHPHKKGLPHTNRAPTPSELMEGAAGLRMLVRAFPNAKVLAIGQKAMTLMGKMGVTPDAQIRHPANGGATQFREGVAAFAQGRAQ